MYTVMLALVFSTDGTPEHAKTVYQKQVETKTLQQCINAAAYNNYRWSDSPQGLQANDVKAGAVKYYFVCKSDQSIEKP